MTSIYPIRSHGEVKQLFEVMTGDNHQVLFPTHLVQNERGIVGFLSVAKMPVFYMSLHSTLANSRDSYRAFKEGESLMQREGHKSSLILCKNNSLYYDLLPKLGYNDLGNTTMNLKNF